MEYTVLIGRSDNGYAAWVEGLTGVCVAAADTREETEALIQEALQQHLDGEVPDSPNVYYRQAQASRPTLRFIDMDAKRSIA